MLKELESKQQGLKKKLTMGMFFKQETIIFKKSSLTYLNLILRK